MVKNDLTKGNVFEVLIKLALPIMGTSLFQMAYNITDTFWIGRLGADAVTAVATAGFFMWFSMAFVSLTQIGTQVLVAQALGGKNLKKANQYAITASIQAILLGIVYSIFIGVNREAFIGLFNIDSGIINEMTASYLGIIMIGLVFSFINPILSSFYNAAGNSMVPFKISAFGLVLNMVLDPFFIFGLDLGIEGAAYATITAYIITTIIFVAIMITGRKPYEGFTLKAKASFSIAKEILKISYPPAVQSGSFTLLAMVIARIVVIHGDTAIAVQRIGTQVESITYITAGGFAAALSSFIGQNYGAGNMERVREGFKKSALITTVIGVTTTAILFFGAEIIFSAFLNEEPALSMGITYFKIISVSQLFMAIEIALAGGFNGLGKPKAPAINSIVFNALRIPAAYFLSTQTSLGLNGIWWSISLSSVLKGIVLVLLLVALMRKMLKEHDVKKA